MCAIYTEMLRLIFVFVPPHLCFFLPPPAPSSLSLFLSLSFSLPPFPASPFIPLSSSSLSRALFSLSLSLSSSLARSRLPQDPVQLSMLRSGFFQEKSFFFQKSFTHQFGLAQEKMCRFIYLFNYLFIVYYLSIHVRAQYLFSFYVKVSHYNTCIYIRGRSDTYMRGRSDTYMTRQVGVLCGCSYTHTHTHTHTHTLGFLR